MPWHGSEPPASGRRRWLIAVAIVPWLAVAVLLLRPGSPPPAGTRAAAPAVPSPTGSTPADGPARRPTATPGTPGPGSVGTVVRSGARGGPELPEATALAAVIARAWIGGVGPDVRVAGIEPDGAAGDVYVDDLRLAGVDHPAPGAVVVTLLALLLHRDGDRYGRATVRRLAVPVRLDGRGAAPAGQPWWLGAGTPRPRPPETTAITDRALLSDAGAALVSAGYRRVAIESLAATDGWALVTTATAVAPGAETPRTHVVWLRRHLGELVVAGDRPRPAPTPTRSTGTAPPEQSNGEAANGGPPTGETTDPGVPAGPPTDDRTRP